MPLALVRLCLHVPIWSSKTEGEYKKWCSPESLSLRKIPTNPCPISRCFKISNWLSFIYNPVTSQTSAFVLVFWTSESMCKPWKRNISDPHNPLNTLGISPSGFQSQTFFGPCLSGVGPRVGVPNVGHKSLSPHGEALGSWDPSLLCVATPSLGFVMRPHLCLSYLSQCGPVAPHCGVKPVFRSFS